MSKSPTISWGTEVSKEAKMLIPAPNLLSFFQPAIIPRGTPIANVRKAAATASSKVQGKDPIWFDSLEAL